MISILISCYVCRPKQIAVFTWMCGLLRCIMLEEKRYMAPKKSAACLVFFATFGIIFFIQHGNFWPQRHWWLINSRRRLKSKKKAALILLFTVVLRRGLWRASFFADIVAWRSTSTMRWCRGHRLKRELRLWPCIGSRKKNRGGRKWREIQT